jgi:hypothetical protein
VLHLCLPFYKLHAPLSVVLVHTSYRRVRAYVDRCPAATRPPKLINKANTAAHQRLCARGFFRFRDRLRRRYFPDPVPASALASTKDIFAWRAWFTRRTLGFDLLFFASEGPLLSLVATADPFVSFSVFVFVRVCIMFSLTYEYK